MDIGVFIPIGNNGWLISTTSPQYMPTFALNREIVQKAEGYGLDFALSMIKLRGFGGKSEFWDHNLEAFTLMAGLAAVTTRIAIGRRSCRTSGVGRAAPDGPACRENRGPQN
jgi:pyrimidine oxygenase